MFHLFGVNLDTFILQLIKVEVWVGSHLLAHNIEVLSENQVFSDWGIGVLLTFLHLQHGGIVRVDRVSLVPIDCKLKLTLQHEVGHSSCFWLDLNFLNLSKGVVDYLFLKLI